MKPKMLSMIEAGEKVLYACSVLKYDRHGYHARPRVLAVTSKANYLFDAKDGKLKQKIAHESLTGRIDIEKNFVFQILLLVGCAPNRTQF